MKTFPLTKGRYILSQVMVNLPTATNKPMHGVDIGIDGSLYSTLNFKWSGATKSCTPCFGVLKLF